MHDIGDYLFVPDAAALRRKLLSAAGTLGTYWQQLDWVSQHYGEGDPQFPEYCALTYLLKGDVELARRIKPWLMALPEPYCERKADDYRRGQLVMHSHCFRPQLCIGAVYLDWLRDSGVVSEEEAESFHQGVMDFVYSTGGQGGLHGLPFGGGQQSAGQSSILALGVLYGCLRGDDPRAREMVSYVLAAFPESIGGFPPGGYSSEGSTYMGQICSPGLVLLCELIEQLTGEDIFFKRYPPGDVSIYDMLRANFIQQSPAGLLLPWNNYGSDVVQSLMPTVYLAAKTGERRYLDAVADAWGRNRHRMWLQDDKLWCLLLWPDEMKDFVCGRRKGTYRFQAIPEVGASLPNEETGTRLFQMWNRSGGHGCGCIRAHAQPNSVVLEAHGSPLILDGVRNTKTCTEFNHLEYVDTGLDSRIFSTDPSPHRKTNWEVAGRNFGEGTFDAHNVVIVGRERGFTPEQAPVAGTLVASFESPLFAAVEADVTGFYNPPYQFDRVRRTSYQLASGAFLIRDEVQTAGEHEFTTRFWLRPETTIEGPRAVTETPEGVRLTLLALDGSPMEAERVEGYPDRIEAASCRLDVWRKGKGLKAVTLAYPQDRLAERFDITEGWQLWAGASPDEDALALPQRAPDADCVSIDGHWALHGVRTPGLLGVYRRTLTIPEAWAGRRILLRLGRGMPQRAWLDGNEVTPVADGGLDHADHNRSPWGLIGGTFDLTPSARPGAAQTLTVAVTSDGEFTMAGPARLCVLDEALPEPSAEMVGTDVICVKCGAEEEYVLCDNADGEIREVGGYRTDAVWAYAGPGGFACRAARIVRGPEGLRAAGDKTFSLCWDGLTVQLSDMQAPQAITLRRAEESCSLVYTGDVAVHTCLERPWRLRLALPESQVPLFVNETLLDVVRADEDILLRPAPPPARTTQDWLSVLAEGDFDHKETAIVALARAGDPEAVPALCEILEDVEPDNWRLHTAAALALGRIGDRRGTAAIVAYLRALIANAPEARISGTFSRYTRECVDGLEALASLADPDALEFLEWIIANPENRDDVATFRWDADHALNACRSGIRALPDWYRHVHFSEAQARELNETDG